MGEHQKDLASNCMWDESGKSKKERESKISCSFQVWVMKWQQKNLVGDREIIILIQPEPVGVMDLVDKGMRG